MARVFVSHSHQDNDFCRTFVHTLQEMGVDTWYDEFSLGVGAIRQVVEQEMLGCDYFVVILSPSSLVGQWVNREIDAALTLLSTGKMKAFLPVLAEACEVPVLLSGYLRIEAGNPPEVAAHLAHNILFVQGQTTVQPIPQVKVVVTPTDPDLDQFFALYNQLFPIEEERSSQEDMMRYIEESQLEATKSDPEYLEELVLVKNREQVIAFLNYTFYYSSKYVLISYIGNISGESTRGAVLGALLEHFKTMMVEHGCLGVIFEVENKRNKQKREIARIRLFRRYLKHYANIANTDCYEIDFNFIQPHLLIEDVQNESGRLQNFITQLLQPANAVQELGVANLLSLGFIPLPPNHITGNTISKEQLMSILQFVYRQVYGDSFTDNPDDDKKYKTYMGKLIKYYERTLRKTIPLRAG